MWAAKHIRLSNRGPILTLFFFASLLVLVVAPFAVAIQKTPFFVVSGVFGAVLMLIARVVWMNRKWNTAELRMAAVPGVIGGPFAGVAILPQLFPGDAAFDVCLKCIQTKTSRPSSGSGPTTSTTETAWSSTITVRKPPPADAPHRTFVPFAFAIPFDCEPTSDMYSRSQTLTSWNLVVAEHDQVGFGGAVFTVPVFRTADSRQDFQLHEQLTAPFEGQVDLQAVLARVQVQNDSPTRSGNRLEFGIWDRRAALVMALCFLVCLGLIGTFFWIVPTFFGACFASLFPSVALFAVSYRLLDLTLWCSSLEFGDEELRVVSGWRGRQESLVASRASAPEFVSEFDSRKQNGEWYRVVFSARSPKQDGLGDGAVCITLVRQLDGRAEAEAVARWLRQAAQLPTPSLDSRVAKGD